MMIENYKPAFHTGNGNFLSKNQLSYITEKLNDTISNKDILTISDELLISP
jgi:hypothetical protein